MPDHASYINKPGRLFQSGRRQVFTCLALWLVAALFLAGCRQAVPAPAAETVSTAGTVAIQNTAAPPVVTVLSAITPEASLTPAPSASATAALTATASPPPTSSPTADPYDAYTIEALSARAYGGGSLAVHETLAESSFFTRTLVSYPSDGLAIYGFMNTPKTGTPPYPVVIALHGYIEPSIYSTIDYTTRYADALARAGFLVLHPNLRGYPPSDDGDNLFRVGMAVDVLNLIALVKAWGGQPGPLEAANPEALGLWGHSMGGGISTRVLTLSPDVDAAVLYGAMSGDEKQNYERIFSYFSSGARGQEELSAPDEVFERISPVYFLDRIQAAVSIHHGKLDPDVPLAWSLDLCRRLDGLGKAVECYTYDNQPHTFHDEGDALFMQRMIDFYSRVLKGE